MRALLFLAAALLLSPGVVRAAGFDMARGGNTEVQIYADNGIEWHSESNRVIARGNAKAVRGDMTLTADQLTAYYRQGASGNEIWRIDADGNVTAANATDTATGVKGTYDLDKAVLVLRGSPARLVTPNQSFSADESMEYYEEKHMAVLRGNGVAVQKDKKIQADVLTAHFRDRDAAPKAPRKSAKGDDGGLDLQYAEAFGHVVLTTAQEVINGDRGDYNMETGIATVSGSVKITRQGNELNGGYAHVDLNTGVSKLFGGAPGSADGGQRVRGTFVPDKQSPEQRRAVFHGNVPQGQAGEDAAGKQ